MALSVEDGTGIEGANSFVTEEQIIAYAEQRGVVIAPEDATRLGLEAMDFLYTQCFGGEQMFGLPFPRDLWAGIPPAIQKAQLQLALDAHRGVVLVASSNPEPMLKREKTGPLESEWFAPGDSGIDPTKPYVPIAASLLLPYSCEANPKPFELRTMRV